MQSVNIDKIGMMPKYKRSACEMGKLNARFYNQYGSYSAVLKLKANVKTANKFIIKQNLKRLKMNKILQTWMIMKVSMKLHMHSNFIYFGTPSYPEFLEQQLLHWLWVW